MAHDHTHHHHGSKNLKIVFFLNLAFTLFELTGGFWVNSVAILSDALHDLGDSLALGLAWFLIEKAQQKGSKQFSFGYQRFSLLGALINSVVLIAGSIFIISEAVGRILEPEHSDAAGMALFAIVGVAVNGFAAWKMSSGKSLNERVVSLHLLEDVLGWVAVLVVAIVLLFVDIHYLDPALSLVITLWVLYNAGRRLLETGRLFLQGVPKGIHLDEIKAKLLAVEHVEALHHTHVWSLEGENHVFTTHVELQGIERFSQVMAAKAQIRKILEEYPFSHYTIETELDEEDCPLARKG